MVTSAITTYTPINKQPQLTSNINYLFYLQYPLIRDQHANFAGIFFWNNRKATEGKEQSAAIIGANSSNHLVSYNSYAVQNGKWQSGP